LKTKGAQEINTLEADETLDQRSMVALWTRALSMRSRSHKGKTGGPQFRYQKADPIK
jgi:predicted transcriptional regulator